MFGLDLQFLVKQLEREKERTVVEIRVLFDDATGRVNDIKSHPEGEPMSDERSDAIADALETVWGALANAGIAAPMDSPDEAPYVPRHRKVF